MALIALRGGGGARIIMVASTIASSGFENNMMYRFTDRPLCLCVDPG